MSSSLHMEPSAHASTRMKMAMTIDLAPEIQAERPLRMVTVPILRRLEEAYAPTPQERGVRNAQSAMKRLATPDPVSGKRG